MRRTIFFFSQANKMITFPLSSAFSAHTSLGYLASDCSSSMVNRYILLIHGAKTTLSLKEIHTQLFRFNFAQNSHVITQLISACSPFKAIDYAIMIFRNFCNPNPFLFNALIRALSDNCCFGTAISHFTFMMQLNVRPDHLTFPFVLKSATSLKDVRLGRALHSDAIKMCFELDSFVRISLLDMYVKLNHLDHALQFFYETPERNKIQSILLWNVMINGCCRASDLKAAVELFERMPARNIASWNSLINGYVKIGDMKGARGFFDQMPEKNVVSWTTMVAGYSQNGDYRWALATFNHMLEEGVKPNDYTIVSVLSACARIGALDAGTRAHDYILQNGFKINRPIGTALIDMYAKCGKIIFAKQVFDSMKEKDILTWSVMILGWAVHGYCDEAFRCFEGMNCAGVTPDGVVFLGILTACAHSGLVDRGLWFFSSMRQDYLIEPSVKHYACIVDLFGRAGRLEEALKFIGNMPIEPDYVVWGALFCACSAHKNIQMAELASQQLLRLEPNHPGSYIFLSNIYAQTGRWKDVEKVRVTMRDKQIEKSPGWSFIEVGSHVHQFVAGDTSHPCTEAVHNKLEELTINARAQGYMPDTGWVLHNIEEEDKGDAIGSHSEKLALAFGLITIPSGEDIRIVKNLRVCGDCHSLMKYASKLSQREIILRDIKRFHHFKNGVCSCKDYW
ncbi:pentatricopeptide repeat-containing protein At1g04840 [Aristolochia californica]|uniref:pentatricopeptide repeat-containing protein At1g04840 n=1 Tax=Aristolochia californica TaxID=171875 RepID=UPI0035D894E6